MFRRSRQLGCAVLFAAAASGALAADDPCAQATATARLIEDGEPGTPMRVSGVVFQPDGATPAAGVILYAYHTDSAGLYGRTPGAEPRIQGWVRTGKDGRFELITIRPAPYPGGRTKAHIHVQLWGPGVPPQIGPPVFFADDPRIQESLKQESEKLGRFGFVKSPVKGPDGVLRFTLDIRLKSAGDHFSDDILHGLKACGVKPEA